MNVIRLAPEDRRLLLARFEQHGNSHRRMKSALEDAAVADPVARLDALRTIERRFRIDLASVCHRFNRRDDPATHPIERMIMNYIAEHRSADSDAGGTGAAELWVRLDRVEEIRDLSEGRLVGEPGS
jgi:hypothetical protein